MAEYLKPLIIPALWDTVRAVPQPAVFHRPCLASLKTRAKWTAQLLQIYWRIFIAPGQAAGRDIVRAGLYGALE